MKANSNHHPGDFTKSNDKTYVNYNIKEIEIIDESGTRITYEYDSVEIAGKVTKSKVMAALDKEQLETDTIPWTPQDVAAQFNDSKSKLKLSILADITYAQLDTYIENNITDLASAKVYLKKISAVVLALLKKENLD